MAYPGQTLENPASGERITFRQTAAEANGELLAVDLELPQDARMPGGPHIHPLQEERFEVLKGTMRFRLRRERIIARPGTVVVVPPGIPHDFANAGDETRSSASRYDPRSRWSSSSTRRSRSPKRGAR